MHSMKVDTISPVKKNSLRVIVAVHDNRAAVQPFIHALKLAHEAKGELEIVDVRPIEERINSIGVRNYLEKWGMLPAGSKRGDVRKSGLKVQKVVRAGNKKTLLKKRIRQHVYDLLVVGTVEKKSRAGIFSASLAAAVAEYFHRTTLFIPFGVRPFVDEETGALGIRRILLPVGDARFYTRAMEALLKFIAPFPGMQLEVTGLHVGHTFPDIQILRHERISWKIKVCDGTVSDCIAAQADELCADLVVMATDGRDSFSRMLTGSKTEYLLNKISCPVLAVAND